MWGRASSHQGVPAPFVYPLARVLCCRLLLSLLLSCPPFLLRVGWLCAVSGCRPVFFDSLCARYAQRCIICSRRGGSCARLAVWRCRASRVVVCGVAAHVCACGPFVVPLGRERGRVSVALVFFFEEATMPERGGTSMLHSVWFRSACY